MTKKNIYHRIILLLFIILILIGCNKNPQKPDADKKEDMPKTPKALTELENEVLEIMYDLDSVTGIQKTIEEEKSLGTEDVAEIEVAAQSNEQEEDEDKKEEEMEDTEEDEKEEEQKSDKNNKTQQPEKMIDMQELIVENEIIIPLLEAVEVKGNFAGDTSPPPDIDTVWNEINDNVTEVHKKWNILEAQLPEERTSVEKIKDFEKKLNNLTLSVMNRKILDSLKLANELTETTTDFRSYFDGKGDHDVYGMYYHIRGTILSAASDNYPEALEHLEEAGKIGDSMRRDLIKKDSEDVLKKFELSIEDLKDQLEDKNFYLSRIKAPIVIKNIKLIQDTLEVPK